MAATPFIVGAIIILIVWVVVIFICVAVAHRKRNHGITARNGGFVTDVEGGRARATTRQPKTVARDFSPVPPYHRRESYGGPAVPAAVYAGAGVAADMPPAYSAPAATTTTTDNCGGASSSSNSSSGGITSSTTTC